MLKRILTAAVLIPLLVLVLVYSHTVAFPITWSILAAVAIYEIIRALGLMRDLIISVPACVIAAGLPFAAFYLRGEGQLTRVLFAAYIFYLLLLFTVAVIRRGRFTFAQTASAFTAVLYVSFAFCSLSMLRFGVAHGEKLYLLVFIGPWVTDTFAYFCGRFFGRHKLIPEISPKKTVEGAIGGTVFGAIAFVVFGIVMRYGYGFHVNDVAFAFAGLMTALVSQVGDLIASLIKREHGVKDYGSVFPGHGGVLDRFDSVLAVAPLLWCLASVGGSFAFLA